MTMQEQGGQPQHLWEVFKVEDAFGPVSLGGSNRIKRVWFHIYGMEDSYVELPLADFMDTGKVAAAINGHVEALINAHTLKSVEQV